MKVAITVDNSALWTAGMAGHIVADHLSAYGIGALPFTDPPFDVRVIDSRREIPQDAPDKIVLYDWNEAPHIATDTIHKATDPRVKQIWKPTVHDGQNVHGVPCYSMGTMLQAQAALEPWIYKPRAKKNLDVSFMGTVWYRRDRPATEHRLAMMEALSRYETASKGTRAISAHALTQGPHMIPGEQQHDFLRRARVAIVPYGHGENSWRHYAAAFAGCVLVGPKLPHWDPSPSRFAPFVGCQYDWSDLGDAIDHALTLCPGDSTKIREWSRDWSHVAARMAQLLKRL